MSSATFNFDTARNSARILLVSVLSSVILAFLITISFLSVLRASSEAGTGDKAGLSIVSVNFSDKPNEWSPFFRKGAAVTEASSLDSAYRLAGTYFEFGAFHNTKRAIIDEIATGSQMIVAEGDNVSEMLILSITSDRVLVRMPGGSEEELKLSFRNTKEDRQKSGDDSSSTELSGSTEAPADIYGGRQVGNNRWVFNREGLMNYYTQLMSEPERLVKVFDSLKPVYSTEGKIEGYELEVFGEAGFFQSTGLKAGDVVRSVNSIKMSNRRRAEYLISEFVKDRVNVIVMDIERDGKNEKFIYQIR